MNLLSKCSVVCLLSSATLSFAATDPGVTPPTGLYDNVVSCQPGPTCFNRKMFGRDYKVLRSPRAEIMVSISTEGIYTRADISILNYDSLPARVTPDDFRVEVMTPKPHVLTYVPPTSLQGVAPDPPAPEPVPAPATPPATGSVITPADDGHPLNIDELYAAKKKKIALQEEADRAAAQRNLASVSVKENEIIRGRVYFERDKKATQVMLTIPIAGMVYQFPYVLSQ